MSPGKKKRRAYEDEMTDPPDPGKTGAKFLAWIKKRSFMREFGDCEDYCNSIGLDLDDFIETMGRDHIFSGQTGRGDEVVVVVCNKTWASKWTRAYKTDLPHHGAWFSLSDSDD